MLPRTYIKQVFRPVGDGWVVITTSPLCHTMLETWTAGNNRDAQSTARFDRALLIQRMIDES